MDLCIGGVIEHLFAGNRDPGPDRLLAAVQKGIPMVLAPCGLDMLSYGGRTDKLQATKGRPRYVQDALRVQVRSTVEELCTAAEVIADRLNQARGPFTFLVPLQGWSSLDRPGLDNYDPEADAAFVAKLKEKLDNKTVIREVDLHLYTNDFARVAVDEFIRLFQLHADLQQVAH